MRPFYAFARMVTRLIFAVLYDVRFEGQENIPAQGGALVVCNHRFAKDPVVLSHAFPHRQIFFMSKAEWFQHKPLGLLLGALGAFPINRGEGDFGAIDHAVELVKETFAAGAVFEGPMPGKSAAECGNYINLDVELAKRQCAVYSEIVREWTVEKLAY